MHKIPRPGQAKDISSPPIINSFVYPDIHGPPRQPIGACSDYFCRVIVFEVQEKSLTVFCFQNFPLVLRQNPLIKHTYEFEVIQYLLTGDKLYSPIINSPNRNEKTPRRAMHCCPVPSTQGPGELDIMRCYRHPIPPRSFRP